MARPQRDTRTAAQRRSTRRMLTGLAVMSLLLALAAIALTGSRDFWVAINLLAQSRAGEAGRSPH